MPAHGVMGLTARGRRQKGGDSLARHALGLAMLVLVTSTAYIGSRVQIADSTEQDVENAAEEPTPSPPVVTAADINAHIVEVATRYGVDPRLVAAIVAVESRFNPRAVSRRGAEGLMQLMPATAAYLDVEDSFDPRDNIDGGVRHLKRLIRRFHNNLPLALAAYNAGEQAVINHKGIPPYRETRQYVIRVLRRYDREAAQAVAQQLAQRAAPSPPKLERVTYAGRAVVAPLIPEPALATEVPAAAPDRKKEKDESP
jgi:hypothetical protein